MHARKRTVAIAAAASVAGLAVAGVAVAETSNSAPRAVSSQTDTVAEVADLQASAAAAAAEQATAEAAAAKAAADKAAAAKAAAQKAAVAKAAVQKAAAQKAAAERAAEQRAAEQRAAAAKAAARKAADERAAAQRQAASRSETRTSLSGSPQQIAAQIVPADQLASFSEIISHESGWNVHAVNASSGAYGLGQALPGSKMASAGPDWQDDAATQIRWALGYMDSRYGSPNAAWQFWQADNWY